VINGDTTKPSSTISAAHLAWWHNYWSTAGLIKITSSDGSGDYIESLRTLYLYDYDAAAERGGPFPGSQAGVADLFNFSQDHQDWFPAGYWFWNLRMQVQANLSAGEASLNDPIFNLYQSNVSNISAWTSSRMPGRSGLCVPETTVAIVSGTSSPISMRTPWPGQAVTVVDGSTGATVVASQANATFSIPVRAGRSYLVELTASPTTSLPFASISGSPATSAKHLGSASIGLDSTGATSVISLRAHANGMYVTADNAGASPLIANRTAIGPWEEFDMVDEGNGNIALFAHADSRYVTADNAGASPLIANRTAIGLWEEFDLIHD
jgi:hypothetical protein